MQIIESLTQHHALMVLGDTTTSLLQCVVGLPPALHALAVEARVEARVEAPHHSVRAENQLTLGFPNWSVEHLQSAHSSAQVLRAIATFTQLQSLSIDTSWCEDDRQASTAVQSEGASAMQKVICDMFSGLGVSLQHICFQRGMCHHSAAGLLGALPSLTALSSIRFTGASSVPALRPAMFCSVVEGLVQLSELRSLQLDGYTFLNLSNWYRAGHTNFMHVATFCSTLAQLTGLTSLTLSKLIDVDDNTMPEHAYLETVRCLGVALESLHLLQNLELKRTISEYAIAPVMRYIGRLTCLTRLVLHATYHRDEFIGEDLWKEPALSNLIGLHSLDLDNYCLYPEHAVAIAGLPSLSHLCLGGDAVGFSAADNERFWASLGEQLASMSSLKRLALCEIGFPNAFLFAWRRGLQLSENATPPSLKSLTLKVSIEALSIESLALCLKSLYGLTMLDLQCGPWTQSFEMAGVTALASSVAGMHHLRDLKLHIHRLCLEGREAVTEAAVACFGPDWGSQGSVDVSFA